MMRRLAQAVALLAVVALPLTACVSEDQDRRTGAPSTVLKPPDPPEVVASQLAAIKPGKQIPLRAGEERVQLQMPEAYTPSAPTGVGTDDYRCFLLDPHFTKDTWMTGTHVLPGNPSVVHHVILFQVPTAQVGAAEAKDAAEPDEGWTCFGGTGLPGENRLDDAGWLGAWAPGGQESVSPPGYGHLMTAGSRIVMQVHYNLLAGASPDVSSTLLRVQTHPSDLTQLHTYELPAPIEMPCRPDHDDNPLCDRDAAMADVKARFGPTENTNQLLHLLCGTDPVNPTPSNVTSCTRTIGRPMTIIGVAGHMHLLGRQIKIEVNPGTPEAKTILDIPVWNFDDQATKPIDPVHLNPFDTVKVTCHHVQWLRDVLPAFKGIPDKYIIWAEGTTDEMCLGLLTVAYDDES